MALISGGLRNWGRGRGFYGVGSPDRSYPLINNPQPQPSFCDPYSVTREHSQRQKKKEEETRNWQKKRQALYLEIFLQLVICEMMTQEHSYSAVLAWQPGSQRCQTISSSTLWTTSQDLGGRYVCFQRLLIVTSRFRA